MRLRTTLALVASTTTLAALGAAPAHAEPTSTLSSARTGDPDVFLTFGGKAGTLLLGLLIVVVIARELGPTRQGILLLRSR